VSIDAVAPSDAIPFRGGSFFPQEFGWIDGKRSPGWNGGRCNAQQRHR
jgi:hypothetical protein